MGLTNYENGVDGKKVENHCCRWYCKKNVLGFRDNIFSYDIQRYGSNDQAYDKLSAKKDC
jgi:hypothetical protein